MKYLVLVLLLIPNQVNSALRVLTHKEKALSKLVYISHRNGIPKELLYAIIKKESNWNHKAVGDGGKSLGLMQVQRRTASHMGFNGNSSALLSPSINVYYGSRYLRYMIEKYGLHKGISAYNAGRPISQNQNYVKDVLKYWKCYKSGKCNPLES